MSRYRWISSYLLTAASTVGLATVVTGHLFNQARAETAPAAAPATAPGTAPDGPNDGSLPKEFLKDTQGAPPAMPPPPPVSVPTKAPSGPAAATAPAGAATPSAAQPSSNMPKPPGNPPATAPTASAPAAKPATPPTPAPAPGETASGTATGDLPSPPAGDAVATSSILGPDDFTYDPTGRRDPFKPFKTIRPKDGTKALGSTLEPLQRYDLGQLRVMGILWEVRQPRALVKDGDGHLHTVVRNTKLGRNNGVVSQIREDEIVVTEINDVDGKQVKQTKIMEFKN